MGVSGTCPNRAIRIGHMFILGGSLENMHIRPSGSTICLSWMGVSWTCPLGSAVCLSGGMLGWEDMQTCPSESNTGWSELHPDGSLKTCPSLRRYQPSNFEARLSCSISCRVHYNERVCMYLPPFRFWDGFTHLLISIVNHWLSSSYPLPLTPLKMELVRSYISRDSVGCIS